MKYLLTTVIIIGFLVSACEEETTIPSSEAYRIVVNGFLETDSTARVMLSRSMAITDTGLINSQDFNNATVILSDNNSNSQELTFVPNQSNYWGFNWSSDAKINYFAHSLIPQAGNEYTLNISAPNLPDATATTTLPNLVDFEIADSNVIIHYIQEANIETNHVYMDLVFQDPPEITNYYLINIYMSYLQYWDGQMYRYTDIDYSEINCSDPLIEVYADHGSICLGLAFSDKTISGNQKRLKISTAYRDYYSHNHFSYADSAKVEINVKFSAINKEYFQYLETLQKFNENRKSPLYPPVQVFSNIEGGYGVFAGAAVKVKSVSYSIDSEPYY